MLGFNMKGLFVVLLCGVTLCSSQKRSRMPTPNSPREPFFPEIADDSPGGPSFSERMPSSQPHSGEYQRRGPFPSSGSSGGSNYQPNYNSNFPPASFPQGDFKNTAPPQFDTRSPSFSSEPPHYSPGNSFQSGPAPYQADPPNHNYGPGPSQGSGGQGGQTGYSYTPGPTYTVRGPGNSFPPSSPQSYGSGPPPPSFNSGPPPSYGAGPPAPYSSGPPPSYNSGPPPPYNSGPPSYGSGPSFNSGGPGGHSPHSFRREGPPAPTHSYIPAPYEKPGPAPAYHGGREERNDGSDFRRSGTTPAQQLEQGLGGLPQFDDFLKDLGFNNQAKSNDGPSFNLPPVSSASQQQPGYFHESGEPSTPDTQYAGKDKESGFVSPSPPNFRSAFANDEEALGFTPARETEPLYSRQSSTSPSSSRAKDSNSKSQHTCRKVSKKFDPSPFGGEDDKSSSRSKRSPVMTCFQCEAADGRFYEQCSYGEEEKSNPEGYFRAHEESYNTYKKPKKEGSSTRTRRDSDMYADASETIPSKVEPPTEQDEEEQQPSESQDNDRKSDEPDAQVISENSSEIDFNVPKETISFEGTDPIHAETFAGLPTPEPFDHRDYFRQLFPEFRSFEEESKSASEPHTRPDSSFFNPPEFAGAEAFQASSSPDREALSSLVADVEGRTQGDQKGCEKHVRGSAVCMVCTDEKGNAREECALQENGPTSRRLAFHSAQEYHYVPTSPPPKTDKSSFRSGALSRKMQDSALGASNPRSKNFFEDFFRPSIFA